MQDQSVVVVIRVDKEEEEDDYPATATGRCCRICHEDDWITGKLETPCGCSGTAKFAHRECIQRWCDVKGDTTCEICQQKYEPNYTAKPSNKVDLMQQRVVTISGSFDIPRGGEIIDMNDEEENEDDNYQTAYLEAVEEEEVSECMSAAERSAAFCKTVAVMLTALLIMKQLVAVTTGVQDYPFSLITVMALRVTGIIIPMYIIIRTLDKMRRSISRHNHLRRLRLLGVEVGSSYRSYTRHQQQQLMHVTVDVHQSR